MTLALTEFESRLSEKGSKENVEQTKLVSKTLSLDTIFQALTDAGILTPETYKILGYIAKEHAQDAKEMEMENSECIQLCFLLRPHRRWCWQGQTKCVT